MENEISKMSWRINSENNDGLMAYVALTSLLSTSQLELNQKIKEAEAPLIKPARKIETSFYAGKPIL
jgi:hypothetical protein